MDPGQHDEQTDDVTPVAGRGERRRRRSLTADLTALAVVGVLLGGALFAAGAVVYDRLYSPSAFVVRYLDLLAQGRAVEALDVPGVRVDLLDLDDVGLPDDATDALLRQAALAPLSDVRVLDSVDADGVTAATVSYVAGTHEGTTTRGRPSADAELEYYL